MEHESWRRDHGRGIMEEESWRRNHGDGIMEEESWRRNHGVTQERDTQETLRRHPGGTQGHPAGTQEAPEAPRRHQGWPEWPGSVELKPLSNQMQKVPFFVDFTVCF